MTTETVRRPVVTDAPFATGQVLDDLQACLIGESLEEPRSTRSVRSSIVISSCSHWDNISTFVGVSTPNNLGHNLRVNATGA